MEFMDHCDLMKEEMKVHLDRLTARVDCLANVTLVLGNDTTKEFELDTSGKFKTVTLINPLQPNMKCKPVGVSLKTQVSFEELITNFTMDPEKCPEWKKATEPEVNFEKWCSDKIRSDKVNVATEADLVTPHRPTEPNMMIVPLVFISGVLITLILALAVIGIRKKATRKEREDKIFHTEENDMYGTYSRGWEEDGEYGDGDVVEIVDRNGYYRTV